MKKIILTMLLSASSLMSSFAQIAVCDSLVVAGSNHESLKTIYINRDVTTHIVAMESIKLVDISTPSIIGDIPTANTLRIKPIEEGASGVVSITMERYMVQYLLIYTSDMSKAYTRLTIPYSDLRSYVNPNVLLTISEMYDYAYRMYISDNKSYNLSTRESKMKLQLNNIYAMDRYYFIDVSLFNKTNIQFDIDQIIFRLEDKRQTRSTNVQSIEMKPIFQLELGNTFKRSYRNIFVFEKFTFPDEKVLSIEVSEEQISGRVITLQIDYKDVLNADSFTK